MSESTPAVEAGDRAGLPSEEKDVEDREKEEESKDKKPDDAVVVKSALQESQAAESLPTFEGHSSQRMLRIMTYMGPGLLLDIIEDICCLLEKVTGLPTFLIYESRWSGPTPSRTDPFTLDACDIAFMCSTAYLSLKERKCQSMELCTAAPLFSHKKANGKPVYFSEVVIHARNANRFKNFVDLKGFRFAYNDEISLSGNIAMLSELRKRGYDQHFFGDRIMSGGHLQSLKMVLKGIADVAAIDSNSLKGFQLLYPDQAQDLVVLESIGPLPIQPFVFNKRLSGELKEKITEALLHIDKHPKYSQCLIQKGIIGFSRIDDSFYNLDVTSRQKVQQLVHNTTYY